MRIGVNTRFLLKDKLEGIGWFTFETISRIVKAHPEHEFYFFFDRPYDKQFIFADNVKPVVVFPPARAPFLWKLWFDYALPGVFRKYKIDAFISTDGYCSLKTPIPQLLVVHDLAFKHHRFGLSAGVMRFYEKYMPLYLKKAKRIVTVSNFSKTDIIQQYGIDKPIDVVHNGFNNNFKVLDESQKTTIRAKYTQNNPYFIFLGAIHPRKNPLRLLQAFEAFKKQTQANHQLVLVGRKAWANNELDNYYKSMEFKADVLFLSHLPLEEVKEILAAAEALVYPSIFEGFGIPILEAMACGVPVITSNTSSMPEVAGNAGLLIDPLNIDSIYLSLIKLYNNPAFRAEMILKGNDQKDKFDWQKSAEDLWLSFEKMMY